MKIDLFFEEFSIRFSDTYVTFSVQNRLVRQQKAINTTKTMTDNNRLLYMYGIYKNIVATSLFFNLKKCTIHEMVICVRILLYYTYSDTLKSLPQARHGKRCIILSGFVQPAVKYVYNTLLWIIILSDNNLEYFHLTIKLNGLI